MISRLHLLLIFTLLTGLTLSAQQPKDIGDVRFVPMQTEEVESGTGYLDARALLQNNSDEQRTVTVECSGSYRNSYAIERTVTLAPKTRAKVSILCPPNSGMRNWNIKVLETRKSKQISEYHSSGGYSRDGFYTFLVLNPLDHDKFMSCIKPKTATSSSSSSRSGRRSSSSVWERSDAVLWNEGANQLTKHWQGLAQFNGVVMTGKSLTSASVEQQQVITDYILSGGTLIVFGTTQNPLALRPDSTEDTPDMLTINYGFGGILLLSEEDIDGFSITHSQYVAKFIETHRQSRNYPEPLAAHRKVPVVPNITVPLRSTFLLMLVFSIVAGPVMIFVLGRKNKRIMLNWTIPALSILTSSILVVYALLSEGITSHVMHSGITHLNQIDKVAVTLGTHGYYSPFVPSKGLLFGPTSELVKLKKRYGATSSSNFRVDWTHGQHLVSGWVAARVPEYFLCRTVERRRERIDISRGSMEKTVHIVNGLGAEIENLYIVDKKNNLYTATNIKAGEERDITAAPNPDKSSSSLPDILDEDLWIANSRRKSHSPNVPNPSPGTYVARLNAAPFMENGLSYKRCTVKADSIIHGVWEFSK